MNLNTKNVPKVLRSERYTIQSVPDFLPFSPLDVSRKLVFCFQSAFLVRLIFIKIFLSEQFVMYSATMKQGLSSVKAQ